MSGAIRPGERFTDLERWEDAARGGPHIWFTLGYRRLRWEPGLNELEWDATADYAFPTADGAIVHGGMVSTILDSAMGGATWTVLDRDEVFLTADLRVEFLRATAPGTVRAVGTVVRRTRRVVFCAAELFDAHDRLLASARCTQVVLPGDGTGGRYDTARGG